MKTAVVSDSEKKKMRLNDMGFLLGTDRQLAFDFMVLPQSSPLCLD
jgi:hypothetical protein